MGPCEYMVSTSVIGAIALVNAVSHGNFNGNDEGKYRRLKRFLLVIMGLSAVITVFCHILWLLSFYLFAQWWHYKLTRIAENSKTDDLLVGLSAGVFLLIALALMCLGEVSGLFYSDDSQRMEYHCSAPMGISYKRYVARQKYTGEWEYFDSLKGKWHEVPNT